MEVNIKDSILQAIHEKAESLGINYTLLFTAVKTIALINIGPYDHDTTFKSVKIRRDFIERQIQNMSEIEGPLNEDERKRAATMLSYGALEDAKRIFKGVPLSQGVEENCKEIIQELEIWLGGQGQLLTDPGKLN
jgi:hypothetical protein